jgi:hypothetical protein
MTHMAVLACVLILGGCRAGQWRYVEEDVAPIVRTCKGGTINTERRVIASTIDGRIRNTTTRVDACLD